MYQRVYVLERNSDANRSLRLDTRGGGGTHMCLGDSGCLSAGGPLSSWSLDMLVASGRNPTLVVCLPSNHGTGALE